MSDTTGPYDPNAVEGDRSAGGQYVTAKDIRIWGIALVVLGVASYPIYKYLEGQSERARCSANLRAVYQALSLYADQHDNRLPPLARMEPDGVTPSLSEKGQPYTWVSDVAPFMNPRQSFVCPTATKEETVDNESGEAGKTGVPSTYGMYAAYAGVLISNIENPDDAIIVGETSNRGAAASLDPKPFGTTTPDGFAIGWIDTNTNPTKATKSVTRLAFPGSDKGTAETGRHGKFVWGLSASGELRQITPEDVAYTSGLGGVNPHWKLPPGYRPPGE